MLLFSVARPYDCTRVVFTLPRIEIDMGSSSLELMIYIEINLITIITNKGVCALYYIVNHTENC